MRHPPKRKRPVPREENRPSKYSKQCSPEHEAARLGVNLEALYWLNEMRKIDRIEEKMRIRARRLAAIKRDQWNRFKWELRNGGDRCR